MLLYQNKIGIRSPAIYSLSRKISIGLIIGFLAALPFPRPPLPAGPPNKGMIHPLKGPVYISGSFAEYRNFGRYHYGIDYKTFNRVGFPVRAPDRGVVGEIQIGNGGYGNAIFMLSGNRRFTFAHLQDFQGHNTGLEDLRIALGIMKPGNGFRARLPRWFSYEKGERLASSGESGTGAPHLHFEIRRGDSYFNPLTLPGLEISDKSAPQITALFLKIGNEVIRYPCTLRGSAQSREDKDGKIEVREIRSFALKNNPLPIPNDGSARLLVAAYDTTRTTNRNGVQGLELKIDGRTIYSNSLNRIPLAQLGRADRTYDTARTLIGREYAYVLYEVNGGGNGSGALRLPERKSGDSSASGTEPIRATVNVTDSVGNRASLEIDLRPMAKQQALRLAFGRTAKERSLRGFRLFRGRRGESWDVKNGGAQFRLQFRRGSLHLPGHFRIRALKKIPEEAPWSPRKKGGKQYYRLLGPAFQVETHDVYYRHGAEAEVLYPDDGIEGGALYYYNEAAGYWLLLALPEKRKKKGRIVYKFRLRVSGPVARLLDLAPPRIYRKFYWDHPQKESGENGDVIREFNISERGAGVGSGGVTVLLDGRPFPHEWIRDRAVLRVVIPASLRPKRGVLLSVRATDFAGNPSKWFFDYIR